MNKTFALLGSCLLVIVSIGATPSCDDSVRYFTGLKHPCPVSIVLGEGASAVTYLVEDKKNTKFALKVVSIDSPREKKKFYSEITKLQLFNGNSNIIQLYDFAHDKKWGYMLLELGVQGSLSKYLKKEKILHLYPRKLILMFDGLLAGVQAMHAQKLVHTDLKTDNVVVGVDNSLKIIDFDMVVEENTKSGGLLGGLQGTVPYIDFPNLLKLQHLYTRYTDIHALGIILYQMAHEDELTFDHRNLESMRDDAIDGTYQINPNTHWLIAYLIVKCLCVEDKDRLSILQMRQLIQQNLQRVPLFIDLTQATQKFEFNAYKDYPIELFEPKTNLFDLGQVSPRNIDSDRLDKDKNPPVILKSPATDYLNQKKAVLGKPLIDVGNEIVAPRQKFGFNQGYYGGGNSPKVIKGQQVAQFNAGLNRDQIQKVDYQKPQFNVGVNRDQIQKVDYQVAQFNVGLNPDQIQKGAYQKAQFNVGLSPDQIQKVDYQKPQFNVGLKQNSPLGNAGKIIAGQNGAMNGRNIVYGMVHGADDVTKKKYKDALKGKAPEEDADQIIKPKFKNQENENQGFFKKKRDLLEAVTVPEESRNKASTIAPVMVGALIFILSLTLLATVVVQKRMGLLRSQAKAPTPETKASKAVPDHLADGGAIQNLCQRDPTDIE